MTAFEGLSFGFSIALQWQNLLACFVGVLIGYGVGLTLIGVDVQKVVAMKLAPGRNAPGPTALQRPQPNALYRGAYRVLTILCDQ